MLKWIQKILLRLLLGNYNLSSDYQDDSLDCRAVIDGRIKVVRCRVVNPIGLQLNCSCAGQTSLFLVSADQAIDRVRFWQLWQAKQGDACRVTWGDGTPVDISQI
jgi:hypothetical protein